MSKGGFFSTRDVLWYLVFFGFAVNYMVRININIAIVAMVRRTQKSATAIESECIVPLNISTMEGNESAVDVIETLVDDETTFPWNEHQQGLILGAFYWMHWSTQVPGGILAQKYGTKSVFGISQVITCVMCFFIPFAAYYHINALLFVRFAQGLIGGICWPAMHSMAAKWIPPNERSKFVTAYLGSSIGAALTFPMCGLLIDWLNWEAVFHVSGIVGVIWFVAWWFFVFDSPAEHPRISEEELRYIERSLGQTLTHRKLKTPWKAILLSKPVWMNTLAQVGGLWGLMLLLIQSPTYFKYIHGWDIRMTGFLSGLPHLLRVVFAFVFSFLGDYLLRSNKMSRTNVRKLATAICILGQAVFMLGLAFADCDAMAAVVYLTAATAIHGSVSTGPLASLIDLSPNFASITLGICAMISIIPGFISPVIVGYLTYQNQTVGQWQIVYLIAFTMLLVTGLLHLVFSESELQPWNSPEGAESEKQGLKQKNFSLQEKQEETIN